MPPYPVDPVVQAEARRLASEDLDRDLHTVADLLAERGYHGPDGRPYPARTVAYLLDEELLRRREDHLRMLRAEAGRLVQPLAHPAWTRNPRRSFGHEERGAC
jgi:hypothetical protein